MPHHLWHWICAVVWAYASRNENYQFKSFHKILLWSSMIKVNTDGHLLEKLIVKYNNTQTNIYPGLNKYFRALITYTWSLQIRYWVTSSFILLIDTSFYWVIQKLWNISLRLLSENISSSLISIFFFRLLTRRWKTHTVLNCNREMMEDTLGKKF